jgi:hypothetical protein
VRNSAADGPSVWIVALLRRRNSAHVTPPRKPHTCNNIIRSSPLLIGRPGDRGSILAEVRDFSSNLCVQTGSGAHSVYCKMGTGGGGAFPQGQSAAKAGRWPLTPSMLRSWMSRSYTSSPPWISIGVLWTAFCFTSNTTITTTNTTAAVTPPPPPLGCSQRRALFSHKLADL